MNYDLVFEGGGAKGIVFVGAIQALEALGITPGRLIGTSAGAITAALLAAGYDSATMLPVMDEKLGDGRPRFASFMDNPGSFDKQVVEDSLLYQVLALVDNPWIPEPLESWLDQLVIQGLMQIPVYRNMFSFIERGGWYAGDAFLAWLHERLNADGRNLGDATLAEFHARTQKDLSVVGSDTTGQEMLILNHRTAPACPIAQAVRMSMSIPFAWQEVTWKASWGTYLGRDITGHTIVDGGLLSNFPIHLLLSSDKQVTDVMGTAGGAEHVLGLLIDEKLPVPGAEEPPQQPPTTSSRFSRLQVKELETVRRITKLVDTVTSAHDKFVIEANQHLVVRLPARGYGTMEFDMSDQRRDALVAAGRDAVERYFAAQTG